MKAKAEAEALRAVAEALQEMKGVEAAQLQVRGQETRSREEHVDGRSSGLGCCFTIPRGSSGRGVRVRGTAKLPA